MTTTILSKPQQKISQLVQNTHEDTQYWKKHYSLNTISNEQLKSVSHGHMQA